MKISKFGLIASSSYLSMLAMAYFKAVPGLETYIFFISLPAVILDWIFIGFAGCGFKGDPWPPHCDLVSHVAGVFVFGLYAILIYFVFKAFGWLLLKSDDAFKFSERELDPRD